MRLIDIFRPRIRGFWIALYFAITAGLISLPSLSYGDVTEGSTLLSYSELMRLPQAKRVEYIEGVRAILVDLAKDPNARFSDSDPRARSKLKVWLEFIDRNFVHEVVAASNLCLSNKFCETALRSCFDQEQGIVWNDDLGIYKCNPAVKVGARSASNGVSSAFAQVDERAFSQYAQRISDPRGSSQAEGPRPRPSFAIDPPAQASAAVQPLAQPAISIIRPSAPERLDSIRTSATMVMDSIGVPTKPKRPGAEARSIEDFVELLAQGKIKGKRYSCRSKHQNRTYMNDKGEAIDHSQLSECSDEDESKIQALYDRVSSPSLLLVRQATAVAPISVPSDAAVSEAIAPADRAEISVVTTRPVPARSPIFETFGRKIPRDEISKVLSEQKSPDVLCEQERSKLGDGKLVFVQIANDGSFGRCMSEANAKLFLNNEISRLSEDEEVVVAPQQARVSTTPNYGKFASCAPKPESCGDRDAIRKAYFQGKLPCVFAGMISNLDGQNRRCQAVTEYKIGGETLKCDVGQAMCNPLLFGTVLGSSPAKAICVGRGQDVTNQCNKISSARDAELFINRNVTGLQEKWDEFKTSIESVCKSETISAKFHCQECNTMKSRLFELHARLVTNPCDTSMDEGVKSRIQNRMGPTKK